MAEQFEGTQIEAIARALGHTEEGLSGPEIRFLLPAAQIKDVQPTDTKWRRLHNAFATDQNTRQDRTHILAFIRKAMKPERWLAKPEKYEPLRARLNQALLFSGLAVQEDGVLIEVAKVSTIADAQRRSNELKAALLKRDAHPDVLVFCKAELLAENFFHAVLEATKSVAAKLRAKSGLTGDGSLLVDTALSGDNPKLLVNAFASDSEKSEQRGFATLLKGVFGMFRNPTAHEARIHWPMAVEDAADLMSTVSLIHRRLDRAVLRQP
jgi:uncharacterized protein (TIGR02391 family)